MRTPVGVARKRRHQMIAAGTLRPNSHLELGADGLVACLNRFRAAPCSKQQHGEKTGPAYKPHGLTGLPLVETKTVFVSRYISIVSSEPSRPKPDCL